MIKVGLSIFAIFVVSLLEVLLETNSDPFSSCLNNRHLKINDYRGPQTSTGHVTRLQPRVYGKLSMISKARGRFSRNSFTSTFICMNVL